MASTSNSLWMPSVGPHPVSVGSSLSKALKARKGTAAPAKRSNLPDREFYSFRYNFKPESIDPTKPGTIEVKRGKESTNVTVERASTQGEGQLFQGSEQAAKEWECVLIYDEELGTFTLEKLDSYVVLQYDRKITMQSNRPSESPVPTPSGSASPVKKTVRDLNFVAQLERDMLGMEDADGEPDDEFNEAPLPVQALKQEEEEGSEHEVQLSKPKTVKAAPSRPSASTATNPKPVVKAAGRVAQPPKPPPPAAAPPAVAAISKQNKQIDKGKSKAVKRDRDQVSIDEEDLEFGKPARPAKVPRPSPSQPPASSQSLALPTVQTTARKPLALPLGGGSSKPPDTLPPPPPPKPSASAVLSDSEDEWDEVAAGPVSQPTVTVTLASDEPVNTIPPEESDEEEIDMHAFEAEMNEHLGEDDEEDFLARAVSPELENEVAAAAGIPMSLNQYAGGDMFGDDDYSSSSDESD